MQLKKQKNVGDVSKHEESERTIKLLKNNPRTLKGTVLPTQESLEKSIQILQNAAFPCYINYSLI